MIFIILACVFGLMMTWSVGANDLANIMSTSMGSKSVTVRQALVIAVIFEFAGAILGGSGVSNTLRSGIINTSLLINTPHIFLYGMLAVLLAGTVWMMFASYFGLPVSVTNAIVGAIVGFGLIVLGPNALHWKTIGAIAITWVASPSLAALIAYTLFMSVQRFIFGRSKPFAYAKRYAPIYFFIVGVVLAIMIIVKGLKHFAVPISHLNYTIIVVVSGLIVTLLGRIIVNRIPISEDARMRTHFINTEKVFATLMALTACAMVFAHGSNDVAIAVGPMAAVITVAQSHGTALIATHLPIWIVILGTSGVVIGLFMGGRKVIATVGRGITSLTPSRAFCATISAASTVVLSTSLGIPVSATQTLVGGILGVGLARGIGALDLRIVRNIFTSWLITIPVGATLTILFYYMFLVIFGA